MWFLPLQDVSVHQYGMKWWGVCLVSLIKPVSYYFVKSLAGFSVTSCQSQDGERWLFGWMHICTLMQCIYGKLDTLCQQIRCTSLSTVRFSSEVGKSFLFWENRGFIYPSCSEVTWLQLSLDCTTSEYRWWFVHVKRKTLKTLCL